MKPQGGPQELRREQRSTRGKRLKAALEEQEAKADDEFWNQDFFAGKRWFEHRPMRSEPLWNI